MKPLMAATATEAPDEQLVAAARDGSDEAFEALFRRYRDRVVGYVRGMVSDHGRAEDIVQEAFMSALRALRRTDQEIVVPALDLRDRQERLHRPPAPRPPRAGGVDRLR